MWQEGNHVCSLELAWLWLVVKDLDHSLINGLNVQRRLKRSPECFIPTKNYLQCSKQESGNTWSESETERGLWGKAACGFMNVGTLTTGFL